MRGFLSVTEVCRLLECSKTELEKAVDDGRLNPIQNGHGKKRWFLEKEIKALLGGAA